MREAFALRGAGSAPSGTQGGAAPAAGPCPSGAASRRRHGLLDHLPPRGVDLRHPLPSVLLLQGREDEEREGICEVDDVLDCVCLFYHCRNTYRHCSFLGQGVLSEKLRSFSMQDLTLIRDEDTVHLRSREPQLHPSGGSLLETIEDSASCYSSGEESSMAQRSNGTPLETRTDPSDEDAGDKLPKRTQSLKTPKKMMKAELPVRSVKARPKKKAAGSLASVESS
ncbi:receptor expression-enhancing protein 2 isoform X5 [Pezoporus wallicus]|uniref:receptor expression-enhancing protein 2 isoform X5 n=1 Tax=Pezoporus wallicus TaxID=35540 RepID=UPI00254D19FD|nr:receptor expression-enhancing protein 2 isoform X5 [Pezoporus wallicus]XP_061313166.1 receptor expression-enhancing protein 2 isoform X5 [Pezoporus flaviventris]